VKPVVFFDKDGTLVKNVPYNVDPARIELVDGAMEALQSLQAAGFRIAIVTNQAGVARGYFDEQALAGVERRLREFMTSADVDLAAFAYCPHHPEGVVAGYAIACDCRKPQPGLIVRTAQALAVDPADCWMVGDTYDDVEAGATAGCRTVLVGGRETERSGEGRRRPDMVVSDLSEAARHIISAFRPVESAS
jgi:histidinol-phosphate phosphatase family protein